MQKISEAVEVRDFELAHFYEDALWMAVLAMIAAGSKNAQNLAHAALQSRMLEYPRWYS